MSIAKIERKLLEFFIKCNGLKMVSFSFSFFFFFW